MSSSAKSMPASRAAMRAISCCFIGMIWREREPPSCWAAMRAWWRVVASMRSWTASAWVRSRRPERKARWVNSPGSARRAPAAMHWRRRWSRRTGEPWEAISTMSSVV